MPLNLKYSVYPANLYDASLSVIKTTLGNVQSMINQIIETDISANIVFFDTSSNSDNFWVANRTSLDFDLNINLDGWPLVDGSYTNLGDVSFNSESSYFSFDNFTQNILYTKLLRKTFVGLGTLETNFTGATAKDQYKTVIGSTSTPTIPSTKEGNRYFLSRTSKVIGNCIYPGLPNELMYDNIPESSGLTDSRKKIYLSNVFGGVLNDLGILKTYLTPGSTSSFHIYFPDYPSVLLNGRYSCTASTGATTVESPADSALAAITALSVSVARLVANVQVLIKSINTQIAKLQKKLNAGTSTTGKATFEETTPALVSSKELRSSDTNIDILKYRIVYKNDSLKITLELPKKLSEYKYGEVVITIALDINKPSDYLWTGKKWILV